MLYSSCLVPKQRLPSKQARQPRRKAGEAQEALDARVARWTLENKFELDRYNAFMAKRRSMNELC